MKPINTRKSKTFSFLLGLIYGYRTADFSLSTLKIDEFTPEKHPEGKIYYLDKNSDIVSKDKPIENPTHIVVLHEDIKGKKVRLYIYKA